jgi:hypothetical protein
MSDDEKYETALMAVDKEVPRAICEQYADEDPIMAWMLTDNLPLTRSEYLDLNYGPYLPDPWTWEHEEEVPEPFRDLHAVKPELGKKR